MEINRFYIAPVWSVANGSFNNDPDTDRSRMNSHGKALASRPSQTRAFRKIWAQDGYPLLIEPGQVLTKKIAETLSAAHPEVEKQLNQISADTEEEAKKANRGKKAKAKVDIASEAIVRTLVDAYIDVGFFGAVVAHPKFTPVPVRGIVSVDMMVSVDPVEEMPMAITRCVAHDETGGDRTMGRQVKLEYALYRGLLGIDPFLAEAYGYGKDKIELFLQTYLRTPTILQSSQRGTPELVELFVGVHNSPYGDMPTHEFKDRVITEKTVDRPTSWKDYRIQFNDTNMPSGVRVFRLEDLRQDVSCVWG